MNFQRSGGDFTVTFSESYVSHYMWAGGRDGGESAVIRPAVLFFLRNLLPTPPLPFSIRADVGVMWSPCFFLSIYLYFWNSKRQKTPFSYGKKKIKKKIGTLSIQVNQSKARSCWLTSGKGKGVVTRDYVTAQPGRARTFLELIHQSFFFFIIILRQLVDLLVLMPAATFPFSLTNWFFIITVSRREEKNKKTKKNKPTISVTRS